MKDHIQQFSLVIALAMTFACATQASAEVYKTVDKDGNVIYTDRPPDPESKPMDLPGLSVIAPQLPSNPRPAAAAASAANSEGRLSPNSPVPPTRNRSRRVNPEQTRCFRPRMVSMVKLPR